MADSNPKDVQVWAHFIALALIAWAVVSIAKCSIDATAEMEAFKKTPEYREQKRKGWHCLAGNHGSKRLRHDDVWFHVKENMRDPDSFEPLGTKVKPVDKDGNHYGVMKYKGRNLLGGMSWGEVSFVYKNSDCSAKILSVKER